MPFSEGSRVLLKEKKVQGTIKYIGPVTFDMGQWVGIVLDEPVGKNNGTVKGKKYFECQDNYGIFLRKGALVLLENLGEGGSSKSSLVPSIEEPSQGSCSAVSVQSGRTKKSRQSMFPAKRSMSMPSIAVEQNHQTAEDVHPLLSKDKLFTLPSCDESTSRKNLLIRYVQGLIKKQLTEAILAEREEEIRQVEVKKEKEIIKLKDELAVLKNHDEVVKHIEERHTLMNEMEEVADDLFRKIEKANTQELEFLVELLKLVEDELPIENISLPKTNIQKQTCQRLLAETLRTLKDYVQLKNSTDCDIVKLSDMIIEFHNLFIEVKSSSETCSILEREFKTRILEYNAKSVMLETRNHYEEKKQKGTLFLQMKKRTKK